MNHIFIPIKSHSERLPGKNFLDFGKGMLWQYVLNKLYSPDIGSEVCEVVVNTDSMEIFEEMSSDVYTAGGFKCVMRKPKLIGDDVSVDILIEDYLKDLDDEDVVFQMHVTSPFLKRSTILSAIENCKSKDRPVVGAEKIKKRLWMEDSLSTIVFPINHNPSVLIPTQFLPIIYIDNSAFYCFKKKHFLETKTRIGKRPMFVNVPFPENIDIDYECDYDLACKILKSGLWK